MIVPVSLGERSYSIHIEAGSLQTLAGLPDAAFPGEVALISNATVAPLVTDALAQRLEERGQRVVRFEMGEGEGYKTLDTAARAFDALAEAGFSRKGAVWAVGGGRDGRSGGLCGRDVDAGRVVRAGAHDATRDGGFERGRQDRR